MLTPVVPLLKIVLLTVTLEVLAEPTLLMDPPLLALLLRKVQLRTVRLEVVPVVWLSPMLSMAPPLEALLSAMVQLVRVRAAVLPGVRPTLAKAPPRAVEPVAVLPLMVQLAR